MKASAVLVFVLLPAVCFAGTASDSDVSHGVKAANNLRATLGDAEGLHVSNAVVTGHSVCMEYSARRSSGVAVYQTDKNLVFVDNTWIWQHDCISGKLGQRRAAAKM